MVYIVIVAPFYDAIYLCRKLCETVIVQRADGLSKCRNQQVQNRPEGWMRSLIGVDSGLE